jgi:dihydroneopterin aldolase
MTDKISLTGVSGFGYHGIFDFEKRDGQTFIVDIEVETNFDSSVKSDDVRDTVNYAELANIIERLADQIARECLDISGIVSVSVTVHKPQAPIDLTFGNVSVTRTLP